MGYVLGHQPVVDRRYDGEGIVPALLAAEDPLVAFVAFRGAHGPDGSRTGFVILWGGFHVSSHTGFLPGCSCCATTGADDLGVWEGRTVLLT
jgi:hypothetical protein